MEMSNRLGISLSSEQQELLLMHLALVLEKNTQLNLTSIKGMQEGIILHIEDSLVASTEMAQAPEGPFWYITHPLRPKGARSILENRTVQKERDPAAPRT